MNTITCISVSIQRTIAYILVGLLSLLLVACSGAESSGTSDKLVNTLNWQGVRVGSQLAFYDINQGFQHDPEYDFVLPNGAGELVTTLNWLGVRTGSELKFYDIDRGFQHKPE